MPLHLSAIQPHEDTREITLDFGDAGTIEMTVVPDRFNIGRQRQLKRAQDEQDASGIADALFAVVQEWDLEDDEGNVIPLDETGVDRLKFGTVVMVATKMSEALGAPKAETPTESPPTSKTRTSRKSR